VEGVDAQNLHITMALLLKKGDDQNHEDERNSRAQRTDTRRNPLKAHPTNKFIIVAKYCGLVLHNLISSLANVVREEAGRHTKNLVAATF